MNSKLNTFRSALGATALFAVALAPSYVFAVEAESATVGQAITDTAISTKLRAKLLADERIKNSDVDVNTTNRVVTLTGKAATSDVKEAAGMIAKQTEGVSVVDNKLVVVNEPSLGAKVEKAADDTGEAITDSYITSKIKSQLLAAKGVTSAGIEVTTNDGVVTLAGHVPHLSEQRKAISIAKQTRGVKSVQAANLEVATK